MPQYTPAFIPGGTYFFTVATLERRRGLLIENIDSLREAFSKVRAVRPFKMNAVVVLPDHLHCIWTLPAEDADYPTRWRPIKSHFSRSVESGERLSARRRIKRERGICQRRYWEHAIQDERDYERHVDYIHINPVKHGYVSSASRWPHSSFKRYVAAGLYGDDWAADPEIDGLTLE